MYVWPCLSHLLFPAHCQLQASCRVAVAAMSTHKTSSGLPTLTCMVHLFASQLDGTIMTAFRGSFSNAVSVRDGDYRFVRHSHILICQIVDMGVSRRPYPALMCAGAMESAAIHAKTSS